QRFFDVTEVINEKNAPIIWEKVNAKLATGQFKTRDLITLSNVKVICTTDDPVDSLEYHIAIKELKDFDVQVLPSFRPDKALEINRATFLGWIKQLGEVTDSSITTYDALLSALEARIRFFD